MLLLYPSNARPNIDRPNIDGSNTDRQTLIAKSYEQGVVERFVQTDTASCVDHDHLMHRLRRCSCLQRYANKLGSLLLETYEDADSPANRQLAKWVSEVTSLMICMAQGNPKVALKHGLADFTSSKQQHEPADSTHRQDAFFVDLVVSSVHNVFCSRVQFTMCSVCKCRA